MRLSIIGPKDVQYHFEKMLGFSKLEWLEHVNTLAKVVADLGIELVLLPDKGIPFELAKAVRTISDTNIMGALPNPGAFGIKHLQPFMNWQSAQNPVFSGFFNSGDWFEHDHMLALFGDTLLVLGYSLRSLGELGYGMYLYKLILGKKVSATHHEIHAGRNKPFNIIVYQPFVEEKLPKEMENYIRKGEIGIFYAKTPEECKTILLKLM